jgi:hypothetical protein
MSLSHYAVWRLFSFFKNLPGSCESRTQPGRAQRRMGDKRSNIANNIFFFSEHPQQQMSLLVGLLNEGTGRQVSG